MIFVEDEIVIKDTKAMKIKSPGIAKAFSVTTGLIVINDVINNKQMNVDLLKVRFADGASI